MEEKKLSLGSVVLTNKSKKKLMIIGFNIKTQENEPKEYDYISCIYPEGLFDSNKYVAFNHNEIIEIYDYGYTEKK